MSADAETIKRGTTEGWIDPPRRATLPHVDRRKSPFKVLQVLSADRGSRLSFID